MLGEYFSESTARTQIKVTTPSVAVLQNTTDFQHVSHVEFAVLQQEL